MHKLKITLLLVSIISVISLTACGKKDAVSEYKSDYTISNINLTTENETESSKDESKREMYEALYANSRVNLSYIKFYINGKELNYLNSKVKDIKNISNDIHIEDLSNKLVIEYPDINYNVKTTVEFVNNAEDKSDINNCKVNGFNVSTNDNIDECLKDYINIDTNIGISDESSADDVKKMLGKPFYEELDTTGKQVIRYYDNKENINIQFVFMGSYLNKLEVYQKA